MHTGPDSLVIFIGTSVLVTSRSVYTARTAQAKKKKGRRGGRGVDVLDRNDGFRPMANESSATGRKPSTRRRPSKMEDVIRPAKPIEDLPKPAKPIEQPLLVPE